MWKRLQFDKHTRIEVELDGTALSVGGFAGVAAQRAPSLGYLERVRETSGALALGIPWKEGSIHL